LLKHLTDHGSPVEAEPASHPFNGAGVPF
jgi:hypothetical protein